jgi:hypothetical protein
MAVAALYPYLSVPLATVGAYRGALETDSRAPGLTAGSTDGNASTLDRVDISPVRSLKSLLKPLPALKQFSTIESETIPATFDTYVCSESPANESIGPAEIAGGFVSEFAPFDPAVMDERIQQFLAKLHDKPQAAQGGGRLGSLAMLSVAVLGGMVGVQLIRRQEKSARRRDYSTRSLRWTATKMN